MKKFRGKKLCAWILAGVLAFNCIPVSAFAQTEKTEVVLEDMQTAEEDITTDVYESKLPVVYINTENGVGITSKVDYVNATMKIQGNDTYSDASVLYDGEIEIRGRGNSTWGMPKKPYKIKLDKKANLFDMGKNKHWVLLANYSDETLMRNTLAYNLSGAMGMPQMETVWVDVVLNGQYVGNYQFCEQIKIDRENRVSIFDWESFAEDAAEVIATTENFSEDDAGDLEDYMKEENMSWITEGVVTFKDVTYTLSEYPDIKVPSITGGYLMELDEYYDEVSKFKTDSEQPIMFKNPEFVSTNKDMMSYIQTYIQSFENAVQSSDYTSLYEGISTHYSELFDFNSLVDYWLISEIFFNEELNKKSTYMYKDIDGLVFMGPIWDMDYSSGGEGQTWNTDKWATTFYGLNAQKNMWYKDLIKDPYFVLRAQERYWEIRDTYVQEMLNSIDSSYTLLKDSADANADIWYSYRNFETEVNNLKHWFENHLTWLDVQMASEKKLLSSLGYEKNLTLSATDSQGNNLYKDTVSDKVAADALVNIGESIILNVSSSVYENETAHVFVNGKKIGSVQIGGNIVITNEQLSSHKEQKNVIEVKLFGEQTEAQNCITVIETDTTGLPAEEPDLPEIQDPQDSSRDYPTRLMRAFADSEYGGGGNEGPAEYVLDGDEKTHFHTDWSTSEGQDVANRWIGVELAEPVFVDGIRYLPRQEGVNGTVLSYEIQYRMSESEKWITVAEGEWDKNDTGWKLVSFNAVEAKQIRVRGIYTYSTSGDNRHMSTAELRVLQVTDNENVKTVAGISVVKTADKVIYTIGDKFEPKGLELLVEYTDGTSAVLTHNAPGVIYHPSTLTPLTVDDKEVTITYGGKTTSVAITVEPKVLSYPTEDNKLPVIYINTENGVKITSKEDYVNATMRIQGNDSYTDSSVLYDGEIEIRGRGNSTWSMPKKPYKIKLDKKSNLFDMGKNKHWVLLANYSDESLMRNTLAYNLSGAMGMPQMETVWVDVVLNGEYIGNYQFCEQIKVDKNNRVSIFDWESFAEDAAEIIATEENLSEDDAGDLEDYMKEENMSWITEGIVTFKEVTYKISDYPEIEIPAITGGYLMELDEYYDEVSKFKTDSEQPIMFKNPEFVGTNKDMMNYIRTYIQSFENAVKSLDYTSEYEGTATHYSELFDFNALVDYWLISEIFYNEEINKKSTYMYKDIDGLVNMGPIWDMDYSSGGEGQTWRTDAWATVFYNTNAQKDMWYKDLIKDPYFVLKAQERYWEIRNTYVQDMLDSIDSSFLLLKDSADANADIWYGNHNFETEVDHLKQWFQAHLSWLDMQMASEDVLLASLGYDSQKLTVSVTDGEGQPLPEDTVSEQNNADAMVNAGESVRVAVSHEDAIEGNADVFVNSKKIGSVSIGSYITITPQQLTADNGNKNIIEVKVVGDKETAQNCITVVEKENSSQPPVDPDDGNDPEDGTDTEQTGFVVEVEKNLVYNGKAQKPKVTVYDGTKVLNVNKDYKIIYKNNKNAGMAKEEFCEDQPYVIIQGKGNYSGELKLNFTIEKAVLGIGGEQAEGVTLNYSDQLEVNAKKAVAPMKSLRLGRTLKKGTDYEVTLKAVQAVKDGEPLNAEIADGKIPAGTSGVFELRIKGLGNYDGEIVKTVRVAEKTKLLKNAKVTLKKEFKSIDFITFANTYEKKLPQDALEVNLGGEVLQTEDYDIRYENVDKVGTATLIIEGKNVYQGTKKVNFKLTGKKFSNATIQVEGVADKIYSGDRITQNQLKIYYAEKDATPVELELDKDYTIVYSNNEKKGKATMKITGLLSSGYQGTVKKTFVIHPESMQQVLCDSSMEDITVAYEKAGAKPQDKVILTNASGHNLVYGKDYTISYRNNKNVGTALMEIKGKGNYNGSLEVPYTIQKASLKSEKITITVKEMAYNKKKAESYEYKPVIIIKDGNKKLSNKNDYKITYVAHTQKEYEDYYLNEGRNGETVSADMPRVMIEGCGNYETGEPIEIALPVYRIKFTAKNLHVVISDVGYTGNQSVPEVTVYYSADNKASQARNISSEEELVGMGFVKLDASKYGLTFGTNIFAGKNKGTVKVTGNGTEYGGSVTFKFHIYSKELKK